MATWSDLRDLRAHGLRPSLPVIVTTDGKRPSWFMEQEGCLVIRHAAGEPFAAELLEGLRVWLFLGGCDRGQAVVRSCVAKGVVPAELRSWCLCMARLESNPPGCEVVREWQ